ncbi:MAG: hypothetical protein AB1478_05115, partial [Nitrospirota bacterium]
GPDSFKRFLNPPVQNIFIFKKSKKGITINPSTPPSASGGSKGGQGGFLNEDKPIAFFGMRACDISALKLIDKVFLEGPVRDQKYDLLRRNAVIIAVNCLYPGDNCFCNSMGAGPEIKDSFDIAITELDDSFLFEIGTVAGEKINKGHVISNKGLDRPMDRFLECIQEYQVEYSTALHSGIKRDTSASPYFVGPISRLDLNHDKLPFEIRDVMKESGITLPITNTQMGIIARSIEIAYAFHEAIRIIRSYERHDNLSINFEMRPGEATWITEAPRGILIHRYKVDERGYIKSCSIISPTSQNLGHIERDIYHFLQNNMDKSADFVKKGSEGIVRGYDPCISCSVHIIT